MYIRCTEIALIMRRLQFIRICSLSWRYCFTTINFNQSICLFIIAESILGVLVFNKSFTEISSFDLINYYSAGNLILPVHGHGVSRLVALVKLPLCYLFNSFPIYPLFFLLPLQPLQWLIHILPLFESSKLSFLSYSVSDCSLFYFVFSSSYWTFYIIISFKRLILSFALIYLIIFSLCFPY